MDILLEKEYMGAGLTGVTGQVLILDESGLKVEERIKIF